MAISYERDIKPMFSGMDQDHMKKRGTKFDLWSYADVKRKAQDILTRVANGTMPPPSSGEKRWTPEMVDKFKQWINESYPP
jgi:hypothetical protein